MCRPDCSFGKSIAVLLSLVIAGGLSARAAFAQGGSALPPQLPPSLLGRIIDDTGNPVTDARVAVLDTARGTIISAFVDANGAYRCPAISAEGTYRILVHSPNWMAGTGPNAPPPVTLKPGETVVVHIAMQPACRVMVQLVDEAGQPVPKVRITLTNLSARPARDTVPGSNLFTTNEQGYAAVGGVPPSDANYHIAVTDERYAFAQLTVKLNSTEQVELQQIVLQNGAAVTGRVLCSDGLPASGWTVVAQPSGWPGPFTRGVPIAADGSFTFPHVVAGKFDLRVGIPQNGGSSTSSVSLAAEVDLLGLNGQTLHFSGLSPASLGTIQGRIEYAGFAPDQMVSVEAISSDSGQAPKWTNLRPGVVEFILGPLPKSPTRVKVTAAGLASEELVVTPPAENVVLKVSRAASAQLAGTVLDDVTGQPVPEFRVSLVKGGSFGATNYREPAAWREFTSPDGKFATPLLEHGMFEVIVQAPGYAVGRATQVNTLRDTENPTVVRLVKGFALRGSVLNEQGQPVDGARVVIDFPSFGAYLQGGPTELAAANTQAGQFEFAGIGPGRQRIRVTHPDYAPLIVTADLGEHSAAPLVLTLLTGGAIRGSVFTPEGAPQAGLVLELSKGPYSQPLGGESGVLATALSDANGGFSFTDLPPGLYQVARANMWQSRGAQRELVLVEANVNARAILGGSAPVTGRLLLNGEPLANTRLRITEKADFQTGFQAEEVSDANGRFRFLGIAPGRRHLLFAIPNARDAYATAGAFDFVAAGNDLGEIRVETGTVTVRLDPPTELSNLSQIPVLYSAGEGGDDFNIDQRRLHPRTKPEDPFVFEHVPLGRYRARVPVRGGNREPLLELTGDRRQVEVVVPIQEGTGGIKGIVAESHRAAWFGYTFSLHTPDKSSSSMIVAMPNGEVEARFLLPGAYRLTRARRPDDVLLELNLAEGEVRELQLGPAELGAVPPSPEWGYFDVEFYTLEGNPLPCESVLTDPSGREPPRAFRGSRINVIDVPPGKYKLAVAYPGFAPATHDVDSREYQEGKQIAPQRVFVSPAW